MKAKRVWPRTLPRSASGIRIWQSGEGEAGILIEARPGPCAAPSERVYEDNVTVRVGGRESRRLRRPAGPAGAATDGDPLRPLDSRAGARRTG